MTGYAPILENYLPGLSGWLVFSAGVCCALLAVWKLSRRKRNSIEESLRNSKKYADLISRWMNRGFARISPVLLTWSLMAALMTVPAAIALAKYFSRYPVYELHDVRVISRIQPLEYWMEFQSPVAGHLQFYARFCPSYLQGFDSGDTLTMLRYEDRGNCWDLSRHESGYLIRRDEHGKTDSERAR